MPEQCRLLADGRLDVGFGRASRIPPSVTSELVRHDPMGVLLAQDHPLARLESIPIRRLAGELLLLVDDARAPEYNEFVGDMSRSAGFTPATYPGTVLTMRCGSYVVARSRCVFCIPRSCGEVLSGTLWRPIVDPMAHYPRSLIWLADGRPAPVAAVRECAKAISHERGWIESCDSAGTSLVPGRCSSRKCR